MEKLSLNGKWQFKRPDDEKWLDADVPGDVYNDLLNSGEIEDPYYGDNELDLQWVGKSDWKYRRTFELDNKFLNHERIILKCDGLDTISEIFINGEKVGSSENMHRGYEFEVGETLQEGKNEILFKFESPVNYGIERSEEYPGIAPTNRYKVDQPARNFIRKAQCHYGWDWGPCLPTVGIWKDIELLSYSSPRIRYTVTSQDHEAGRVRLKVRVGLDALEAGEYKLLVAIAGKKATNKVSLQKGENESEIQIELENPDLWWPAGYGEQNLYDMEVSISDGEEEHKMTKKIGLRQVELVREPDEEGESFFFKVNGVPIYAKGANWIPADSFYGRMSPDRYEDLLRSALEANMNMIRIWGGGIYELDDFYQYCDENGILVWQDFMFACSAYPTNDEFLENVEEEVRYQVRRLTDHPSIVLWCGNNENEVAVKHWYSREFDEDMIEEMVSDSKLEELEAAGMVSRSEGKVSLSDVGRKKMLDDYEKLYLETIGGVVEKEDPSRSYWPSSPSSAGKSNPMDPSIGDSHYWEVWHGGEPFSNYLTVKPRFASEFGYQSFPSVQTLKTVMEDEDLNPTSPLMEHHQRHEDGNALITSRMSDHFRYPFSFKDFVYLSQIQQGLAMKTAIEHWRRLKPHCMGTIYWQLNDIWPVASWSSLEYSGKWKALQYMAKRFFAPILISTMEEGDHLEVWLTSDLNEEIECKATVEAFELGGRRLLKETLDASLDPLESKKIGEFKTGEILSDTPAEETIVRVKYEGPGESYSNYHLFKPFKSLNLPETKLEAKVEDNEVEIEAREAALFVRLDSGSISGTFSENYFHMGPGETRKIEFTPRGGTSENLKEELEIKHLRNTY
ncbi:glycoside hydrolase family 2 [candidate division MSBL1 archaeon SCGC-AAA259E19]|uniref:Beta-mannosidase B n=1 Tax=candidate division MSBL1 archaeon SCGC-AAA259E19 TaxID=1698264 RepID=A0A133UHY8_9EURY|nr:glycoside hydrolase family 2 [candidate division MSBL1 archaeon SCGC-AAA259E19]